MWHLGADGGWGKGLCILTFLLATSGAVTWQLSGYMRLISIIMQMDDALGNLPYEDHVPNL
jgi:hypothetical protein